MDWLDLLAVQGTLKSLLQHHSSKASIVSCSAFFTVQLSHPYMTTGKTIALTRWTFVGIVISLVFLQLLLIHLGPTFEMFAMGEEKEGLALTWKKDTLRGDLELCGLVVGICGYLWDPSIICGYLWDPLEKEMATHSSILAWRIPQTEEPGGLESMGSQSQTPLSY